MFRSCSYEREVTQALSAGHWPSGCGAELRAHVDGCASCRDLVLVTQTFQMARSESVQQGLAGSASLLWWRAQLRRRNAATRSVSRPITIAQIFAWGITGLTAIIFVASQSHHGLNWASWVSDFSAAQFFKAFGSWNPAMLLPIVGLLVVLSGVMVYLVSEKQ
jgi:hypothetical protein